MVPPEASPAGCAARHALKQAARACAWRILEDHRGTALEAYPPSCVDKIPHFRGAHAAAQALARTDAFKAAQCVKVNPSLAQQAVRQAVLAAGKALVSTMPMTDEILGEGAGAANAGRGAGEGLVPFDESRFVFYYVDPGRIPFTTPLGKVVTKQGMRAYGIPFVFGGAASQDDVVCAVRSTLTGEMVLPARGGRAAMTMKPVDLVVLGATCVSTATGLRLGKGKGYAEREYAVLRRHGLVADGAVSATTCHDLQVFENWDGEAGHASFVEEARAAVGMYAGGEGSGVMVDAELMHRHLMDPRHDVGVQPGCAVSPLGDMSSAFEGVDRSGPTEAWVELSKHEACAVVDVEPMEDPDATPQAEGTLRFVCVSDTHGKEAQIGKLPRGDVLVHAGDFTSSGELPQIEGFSEWLGQQDFRHKIVIAGNHDITLDEPFYSDPANPKRWHRRPYDTKACRAALRNCTHYLEDEACVVDGVKVWGSPWTPFFFNWGFNAARGEECNEHWQKIPADTDVLLTHGPPLGHGDLCFSGDRAGCVDLLQHVTERVRPQYHVFGHIHEGYGMTSNGTTTFVNASTCNFRYKPVQPALVFDVKIPAASN